MVSKKIKRDIMKKPRKCLSKKKKKNSNETCIYEIILRKGADMMKNCNLGRGMRE